MENQIHQFDSSLKQGHAAQNTFANAIEDAWGKCSGSVRNGDLPKHPTKCDDLDFSNNIYGDKLGPSKFDGKPKTESFGEKDDVIRQKKEAALKEDYLRGIKKEKDANGDVKGDKKDAEGKGKEVKDGGPKSKFENNGNESGDNSGLTPMPGKEVKDGGDKSNEKPGKNQQQETVKKPMLFFPDKPGQTSERPSIHGTEAPNLQADSDEYLL